MARRDGTGDQHPSEDGIGRRTYLGQLCVVVGGGLAGCQFGSSGTNTDSGTATPAGRTPEQGTATPTPTEGGTETATSTRTPTETPESLDREATAQFCGGLENHGYIDTTIPTDVEVDWSLPVNEGDHTAAKSSPIPTGDGDIIIAGDTGTIRRVSPDREIRWTAAVEPTNRGIHGTPAIANGMVYVGAYDGAFYAFDLDTGQRLWRTELGDAIGSSPVYYDGTCYIAVEYDDPSGSIEALDAETGRVTWSDDRPTDHPHSTIGIDLDAGRLVVGANDGICYAWTFPGLERAWTFETDSPIKGPIGIDRGLAIFGSWDSNIYAVDVADGTLEWLLRASPDVMTGPAITPDGTVYMGSHDTNLYAIDMTTGNADWWFSTDGYLTGALTATRSHVLAGSWDTSLYAVEAATGEQAWQVTGRGHATSAPLVHDGAVYYAERAGEDGPGQLYRLVEA